MTSTNGSFPRLVGYFQFLTPPVSIPYWRHESGLGCSVAGMARFWTRTSAAIIVALSMAFVASTGEQNLTQVYVYVQHETPARSWFPVWFDGVLVAKIKRGRFFVIDASPGRHMVSEEKGVPVFIDVRAGKEVFVRLEWRNGELPGPALPVWDIVSQATAHNDMLLLAYIDADKAISKSVPKADSRKPPPLRRRGESD